MTEGKEKTKELVLPWWGKVLAGGLIAFGLYKFTPLLEVLYLFLQIVLVPLLFFGAIGLISSGTIDGCLGGISNAFQIARDKAKEMTKEDKGKKAA